ncbi:MAG: FtsQ-type POTRA domain-containing protein [Acidimicrobiales bacterium]|jgi:cell division protein FtsQ
MDPKIRQRRVVVTRQRGRRRLRAVIAGCCVLAVGAGAFLTLHTGLFSARHVTVRGARHTPVARVVAVAGLRRHPPLLDVDPGRATSRLEKLPWVQSAVVERHWPDSVSVVVTERVAVAAVLGAGGVALVDESGRVLEHEPHAPAGIVTLVVPEVAGRPGSVLGGTASGALVVARDLPPLLRSRVTSVTVATGGGVVLDLGDGLRATLGSVSELAAKFEALESLLAGTPLAGPAMIDLTVPEEPTVSAAPAVSGASAAG